MAAAEDVQARVGDEPVHEMGVGQRDDGVIVAGHDEHGLPQPRQERHAGPAGRGGELIEIAPGQRRGVVPPVQVGADLMRLGARRSPVQQRGETLQVPGVGVAPGRGHPKQNAGPGGHHERTGGRAGQDQAAAAPGLERREVLRHCAAPGDAEHVSCLVPELGQQCGDEPAQPAEPVGALRQRRAAGPRDIEADHGQGGIERVHERLQHLETGANAVDQEQRNCVVIPGPYCDAYLLTADIDVLNLHSNLYTRR